MLNKIISYIISGTDILLFGLIGVVLVYATTLDIIIPETIFFKFVMFTAAAFLLQYLLPRPFIRKILIMPLAAGLFYMLPIPVIACYTGQILNCHHDIFFGMYLTLFLGNVRELLIPVRDSRTGKAAFIVFSALMAGLALLPLANIIHCCMYGINISEASVFALLDTDLRESLEYVKSYFSLSSVLLMAALFAGATCLLGRLDYGLVKKSQLYAAPRRSKVYICLCLFVLGTVLFSSLLQKTLPLKLLHAVKRYRAETASFRENNQKVADDIKLIGTKPDEAEEASSVILVIGESACRDYMKAFTPSFSCDDTPWLSRMKADPDFLLFKNAYACFNQTVPCLVRALTEASQYNKKSFVDSATVINAARKLGYKTYWFTNQGRTGVNDANITMIAETADCMKGRAGGDVGYDHDLIDQFKAIKYGARNFIVFHLMGSHIDFVNRYPKSCAVFKGGRCAEYANSILYTDCFLQQLYEYAKKNLNLRAMIYFSDHGDDYASERHPDVFNIHTLRIPLFMYLSPEYQREHQDKFRQLRLHMDQYFTNDMIYNTLCGMLSGESNHYDKSEDLSSPAYAYNKNNIRCLGKPVKYY
ncbi:phosphoethanolamine transferase [bacterium]|nr:phosphoethanolamine transferase [bacterium]